MNGKAYQVTLLTGEEEARLVHSAVTLGDHDTLSALLCTLSQPSRPRLLRLYKAIYGKKLTRVLKETLAGDYLHICLSVVSESSTFIVKEIHEVLMEFPQPLEELIIAMLCKRSKEEIIAIKTTYKKRFFKSLEEGIETLLESDAAKWIKLLVTWEESDCCCDLQQASRDTQMLLTLGVGRSYGQDGPVLASLIKRRCPAHMRNVFNELRRLGRLPTDLIESVITKDVKRRIVSVVQAIDQPELFNAHALGLTRSWPGRLWQTVLNIRLTRSKEFYKKVEIFFDEKYNTRIQDEIKKDTGENTGQFLKKLIR